MTLGRKYREDRPAVKLSFGTAASKKRVCPHQRRPVPEPSMVIGCLRASWQYPSDHGAHGEVPMLGNIK